MNREDLQHRLELAVRAAREAGAISLEYFGAPDLTVHSKADASPVTEADRRGEQRIRELIGQAFPDDGFLGEEFGETSSSSGARWILDPIDGTKSFVRGVPLYGTLVALEAEGDIQVGVVYLPALDEIVYAAKGLGAWWVPSPFGAGRAAAAEVRPPCPAPACGPGDPVPVRAKVSQVGRLADALFCTTSPDYFHLDGCPDLFERLRAAALLERGWSDCYGYVLVATGRAEFIAEPSMHSWDCAALKPIVEEAGGTFTDLAGNPTIYGGSALATNGALFEEIMKVIQQA
jgi:histidinol-phosphatase